MNEGGIIAIIIALIGVLGTTILGVLTLKGQKAQLQTSIELALIQAKQTILEEKQGETHKLINSRMTELLELTRTQSKAEGKLEGKAEEKADQKK